LSKGLRHKLAALESGIPEVEIEPGDHLCAFYRGRAERDELIIPFLNEGLKHAHKCMCFVDSSEPDEIMALIGDAQNGKRTGQLEIKRCLEIHLRGGRGFDTDEMMAFWERTCRAALGEENCDFFRAIVEMTWALRDLPGVGELVDYESKLNTFMPRYPQIIVCMYDVDSFGGDKIVDMLKTHPKVLLGGMIFENPYYVKPEEFLIGRN
jgi:hypothetical protein